MYIFVVKDQQIHEPKNAREHSDVSFKCSSCSDMNEECNKWFAKGLSFYRIAWWEILHLYTSCCFQMKNHSFHKRVLTMVFTCCWWLISVRVYIGLLFVFSITVKGLIPLIGHFLEPYKLADQKSYFPCIFVYNVATYGLFHSHLFWFQHVACHRLEGVASF